MLLPKDILSGTYRKPDVYLCEADKSKICKLETSNMSGTFKFNAYSELTFDVARVYNDIITGSTQVNPYYNKIEALRLILLDDFGYFEIQDPEIDGDGIKETKSLVAYSLEYTLSQKYLETFYVNRGTIDSVEVLYLEEQKLNNQNATLAPVTFYNQNVPELSLLHLVLEKAYGWTIGHVDDSLKTMSRQFEVDRESIYDFIMNEVCEKFNCYAIFDTFKNEINFYAETSVNKFTGDGITNTFTVYPVFSELGTVSIDGYKTIDYEYNNITGELKLGATPPFGAMIEVTDGSLSSWETDVYVTFDNLAQEMHISYPSDDIKTVLTVKGADDLDIREVNNGLPYIVDLSYFYNVDRMGQDLYDKYTEYLAKCTASQNEYKENSQEIIKLSNRILYETNRLSLQYREPEEVVTSTTVGTYYTRHEHTSSADGSTVYYYTEVSLPADYIEGTEYYSVASISLNEDKFSNLYEALQKYYKSYFYTGEVIEIIGEDSTLVDDFSFMEEYKINGEETYTIEQLNTTLSSTEISAEDKDAVVLKFLSAIWDQLGLEPLKTSYLAPYKKIQTVNASAGWSEKNNDNYGSYYLVVLILESIEDAINKQHANIDHLNNMMSEYSDANAKISASLLIDNPDNFTPAQIVRLSAFLREDEYVDDNFAPTGNESTEELFKLKQELLECGRIELSKLCEPRLKFTMSLANIYALPEFAPIVNQFKLGNLIKIALRPDYIKHTRLMQVNFNFEDFSDFSCEFGDLSSVRSQTDLHADLLSQAISAGKTVASNASYWDSGTDTANSIDVRLQQGLLNAATEIKDIDGNQLSYIDKYGIHLQAKNPDTGAIEPEQGWIVNNKILYSDDAFKTTKSVFGKYKISNNEERWGLLADAVVAGYIEGSTMIGGTIKIGDQGDGSYAFEVDEYGNVTMGGNNHAAVIKFMNCVNPSADFADQFLVAYIELYQDGSVVDKSKTSKYYVLPSDYNDNLSSQDLKSINTTDNKYIYFVHPKTSDNGATTYNLILGEYIDQEIGWTKIEEEYSYSYTSNITERDSKVFVIPNVTSASFNDVEAVIFDDNGRAIAIANADADIAQMQKDINNYFKFNRNDGLIIGQTSNQFYVQIEPTKMGFHDNSGTEDVEVVSIGGQSATIQNATFNGDAQFNNDISVAGNTTFNGQVNMSNRFIWNIEENGSLSLSINT